MSAFQSPSGGLAARPGAGGRIEAAAPFELGRAGEGHVIVGQPFHHEVPARHGHRCLAGGAAGAGAIDQGRAGR